MLVPEVGFGQGHRQTGSGESCGPTQSPFPEQKLRILCGNITICLLINVAINTLIVSTFIKYSDMLRIKCLIY